MRELQKPTVMVVGGGTMGSGIAQVFAAAGHEVYLASRTSSSLRAAEERVAAVCESLVREDLAGASCLQVVEGNLQHVTYDELVEIAPRADFVFESIVEDPAAKKDLYEKLNAYCRQDCVLASNTSGMDVFSLCSDFMSNPGRQLIAHWFNPPHLMKLVEVVRGPKTSDAAVEQMCNLLKSVGKKPAVLNTFIPGFIVNRIATAINRELYYMLDQGWVSAEDADAAIRYTHGLRFGFEGPLALWDVVGAPITMAVSKGGVLESLCNDADTLPFGEKLLAEGKLGVKTGAGAMTYEDPQAYMKERERRIVQMTKVIESWE